MNLSVSLKTGLIRKFFLPVLVFILLASLPLSSYGQDHHDWSYNLGIYEVNVRQYTSEGTFEAFSTHLDRLEDLGAGILWFMPIHPIGEENRLGSLGSYYSVKDFLAINPNFGTMERFKELVQEIHERDMHVILDWVANHTSWDNVLTDEHPEWYVTNDDGEFIPPPGTNWSDVIELDYTKQGLRQYMIDAMKFWVDSTGIDGFRFDAVSFVPDDFWVEAIDSLKSHKPDIFLLAENDGAHWHELGFDMSFAWGLYGFEYGVLKEIADGSANADDLNTYAIEEKATYGGDDYRMYFTSNHDENSWHGTTAELFGNAAEVFAVLTGTFHGMPLIYSGQEAGLNKRLSFFDKDQIPWQDHPNADLYQRLLYLKKNNQALWNGDNQNWFRRISTSENSSIFAYIRKKDSDRVFAVLNVSGQEKTFTLNGTAYTGTYQDVFTDEIVTLEEAAEFTLPAWRYQVFESGGDSEVDLEHTGHPFSLSLRQNYPNPFNPSTLISYQLPANRLVRLEVFDVTGRKVAVLVNDEIKTAGTHRVTFDAGELASGIYIYRLKVNSKILTKKMLLVK